eukprot:7486-Heterococcus_DN1.PRE.1
MICRPSYPASFVIIVINHCQVLCERGIAVIQPDLIGHGYSEGTRAFAQDWHHWLEDHRLLLDLVAGGSATANTADATSETRSATAAAAGDTNNSNNSSSSKHNLGLTQQQAQRLARVPIFLSGESLGGGQSLALGLQLQEEAAATAATADGAAAHNKQQQQLSVAQRFAGVALLAPAIRGKLPPKLVCTFLRYCIVPLVPERRVPAFLDTVAIPAAVWKREEDIAAYKKDLWGVTPQ